VVEIFKGLRERGRTEGNLDVGLAIVGDGHYRETLETKLAGLPVLFTGYLHGEELAAAFASSSVMIFPSTTETFGNVVLEALASGLPAAVSDIGGPSEIVQDGATGFVLPAGNTDRWLQKIAELLADPERLTTMSRAARAYATEHTYARAREETWAFYLRQIARARAQMREAEVSLR